MNIPRSSPLIGDIIKSCVWDTLVDKAIALFFAGLPAKLAGLAWGPVGAVITYILKKGADALYVVLKELYDVQVILIRNQAHLDALTKADVTLKIIAFDKGIESKEFLYARENAKRALAEFVAI